MAWTYLAATEDSATPSETTLDRSPTAKSTPIVEECFYPDKPMDLWDKLQYGMIYGLSQVVFGPTLSTSFTVAFLARGSALRVMEKAWQTSEAAFIGKSIAWPKKSSPRLYSLKTFPRLDPEEDLKSLEVLPKSGMTLGFACYPLSDAERLTEEIDGSCLPTPCSQEGGRTYDQHMEMKRKMGQNTCSSLSAFVEGLLPTPKASEYHRAGIQAESKRNSPSLWYVVIKATGKKLNPPFVEWMMGLPIGWTELEPWAMESFRKQRKKRSNT